MYHPKTIKTYDNNWRCDQMNAILTSFHIWYLMVWSVMIGELALMGDSISVIFLRIDSYLRMNGPIEANIKINLNFKFGAPETETHDIVAATGLNVDDRWLQQPNPAGLYFFFIVWYWITDHGQMSWETPRDFAPYLPSENTSFLYLNMTRNDKRVDKPHIVAFIGVNRNLVRC